MDLTPSPQPRLWERRLLWQRRLGPRDVSSLIERLEADGFAETPEGNMCRLFAHADGREVTLEQETARRVRATCYAPLAESRS